MRNIKGQITFVKKFLAQHRDEIMTEYVNRNLYEKENKYYLNGKEITLPDVLSKIDNTILDVKRLVNLIPTTD